MTEYFELDKNGIDDFRAVILPNIREQLVVTASFEEQGLRLIGAAEDGKPVGALVAGFLENEEVYIYSLYVAEDYRRRGIGAHMILDLCTMASEVYTRCASEDFPLFLHTEYTLPAGECAAMESFLKKQGFVDFLEKDAAYLFEREELMTVLRGRSAVSQGIRRVTEMESYDPALFAETFEAVGFTGDPAFCFFHQEGEEDADFLVSAVPGDEGDFYLTSTTGGTAAETGVCCDTAAALLHVLCEENPEVHLIVDGESNEPLPLWEELLQGGGLKCRRQEAGMYVVFEA